MRKRLQRKIIVALVCGLLLSLTGCVVTTPLEPDRLPNKKETPEVELTVQVVSKGGDPALQVLWKNNTGYCVTYGEPYSIQYQQDGQWVSCAVDDAAFITVAYMLDPGQSRQESYNPVRLFSLGKPGNYRFLSNCTIADENEGGRNIKVSAEFTLPVELVVPTSPVFRIPPRMTVVDGETSWQASSAGYHWSCPQEDGTVSHTIADAMHPLYCRDTLEKMMVTGAKGKLAFLQDPDKVTMRCWPDTAWERDDIPSQSLQVTDLEFDWQPGGNIYEVSATWQETENAGHGTAHYYFYAEVQP